MASMRCFTWSLYFCIQTDLPTAVREYRGQHKVPPWLRLHCEFTKDINPCAYSRILHNTLLMVPWLRVFHLFVDERKEATPSYQVLHLIVLTEGRTLFNLTEIYKHDADIHGKKFCCQTPTKAQHVQLARLSPTCHQHLINSVRKWSKL